MKEDLSIQKEQGTIYEKLAEKAVEKLNKRGIRAQFAVNKKEALSMVMEMIPAGTTVGTADSLTLVQLGIFSSLRKRGQNEIVNPFERDDEGHLLIEEGEERYAQMRKVFLTDVFVIGTNAVTLDGKLVNTDGYGNRVAAMIFGPRKVIIVVGANKIVKDAEEAIKRIREICAPLNAIRHANKHHSTTHQLLPCYKTGICSDCIHPWRRCCYTTIIEGVRKSEQGRINVILVGEKLGI
ncbi:MAG: lactate utilization protein [Deltaproteobacteria bacterium]|nr:lactate utilization protein [Deltaproteobacteria bacterium]